MVRAFAFTFALTAALPTAPRASEVNQNLEEARKLFGKARYPQAEAELKTAEALPGTTVEQRAEIYALRASIHLVQKKSDTASARRLLLTEIHLDPSGDALTKAGSTEARELGQALRAERSLVLHERFDHVVAGRPILLRARLSGPPQAATFHVHYRPEEATEYAVVQLEKTRGEWSEIFLRPGVGGVPASVGQSIAYYIDATTEDGSVLDSNGDAANPLVIQLTTEAAAIDIPAAQTFDEGWRPPAPPPEPIPLWEAHPYWIAAGGVAAVGLGVGLYFALRAGPNPRGTLGEIDLSP